MKEVELVGDKMPNKYFITKKIDELKLKKLGLLLELKKVHKEIEAFKKKLNKK